MWERWIRRGLLALSVVLAGFLDICSLRDPILVLRRDRSPQWVPNLPTRIFKTSPTRRPKGILFNGKSRRNRLACLRRTAARF